MNSSPNGKNFHAFCKATFPSPSDSPPRSRMHYLEWLHSFQPQWNCCSPLCLLTFWIIAWTDNRIMSNKIPTSRRSFLKDVLASTQPLAMEMHAYPLHLKHENLYCFLANLWIEGSLSALISLNFTCLRRIKSTLGGWQSTATTIS